MGKYLQSSGEYVKNSFSAIESYLLQLKGACLAVRDVLRLGSAKGLNIQNTNDESLDEETQNNPNKSQPETGGRNLTTWFWLPLCCCFLTLPSCCRGTGDCKCANEAGNSHHCVLCNFFVTLCSTSGVGCCFNKYFRSQYIFHAFIIALPFLVVFYLFWMYYDEYMSRFLTSFEQMDPEVAVALFLTLFIIASFPLVWGYVILNLAAGYRFGVIGGVFLVMVSVTFGLTISHKLSQRLCVKCISKALKCYNRADHIEGILKVLDGPSGLKVIALTRLTPIPFGLQNGIFAMSNIKTRHYVAASNIGLLPTQLLNCYLGSTFRSAEDIISRGGSMGGYLLFFVQLSIGFTLMTYVIRHAKKELAKALNDTPPDEENAISTDEKLDEFALSAVRVTQPISESPT